MSNSHNEWTALPVDAKNGLNLDQAELNAWRDGAGSIEDAINDERCSGELDDETGELSDDLIQSRDLAADAIVGGAAAQAEKRRDDLAAFYPFDLNGGRLKHHDDPTHWAYGFCLTASLAGQFEPQLRRKILACFEILVRDALEAYFGEDTAGFRTGHPWDIYSAKHFKRAKAVYKELFKAAGDRSDWKWSPREGYPDNPSYQREKDLGVDVVVWKTMPDNRGGRLYILTQCATTENNLVGKSGDVRPNRLANYLTLPDVRFVRALATPTCMLNTLEIRDVSRNGGLLFDRSRLVKIVNSAGWGLRERASEDECRSLFTEVVGTL